MSYCTQSDILLELDQDTLIQLTDDDGAGVINEDVVDRAIADADSIIDSYCQGLYAIPLSPVPTVIRMRSVEIAVYKLYTRVDHVEVPENRKERYQAALKFLERVPKKTVRLGASTPIMDSDSGPESTTSPNDRVFTSGSGSSLENF